MISDSEYLVGFLVSQREAVSELPEAKVLSGIQKQLMEEVISAVEKAEDIE
jgi:hypothetical protein